MSSTTEIIATVLFFLAIIHTFSVPIFARLAHKGGTHAGIWHLMSEVEAVFGVWATVLIFHGNKYGGRVRCFLHGLT
jgi:hypothetical protein